MASSTDQDGPRAALLAAGAAAAAAAFAAFRGDCLPVTFAACSARFPPRLPDIRGYFGEGVKKGFGFQKSRFLLLWSEPCY